MNGRNGSYRAAPKLFGLIPVVVVFQLLCVTTRAQADGLFTPFAGTVFGAKEAERVTTFGASLAGMAGGVVGFEIDFAKTDEAKNDTLLLAGSKLTTATGNVIVGIPFGVVRPYFVGGLGWLWYKGAQSDGAGNASGDGLGIDVGVGVMGFPWEHVGARIDVRYFRAIAVGDSGVEFSLDDFYFVRVVGGVVFRF